MTIAYAFAPAFHGRGLASEAMRAVVSYAFDDLRVARLVADTSEDNVRSRRLMERLGMTVRSMPRPGWDDRYVGVLANAAATATH